MGIKIIDPIDGSVQGWFISLCITISIFVMIILALLFDPIANRWGKIGGSIVTAYLGQFGAWLAYRGAKAVLLDGSQENKVSE